MELGSINIVVKDADKALDTYLKLFGTNNIHEVIKVEGLNDSSDIVNGYFLKTKPIMIGLLTPLKETGKMGQFLKKNGEGMHHVQFHLGQDEFDILHKKFQGLGWPISEKPIYVGKLNEAMFWLEESGEQQIPIKFATKAYHGYGNNGAVYLDTPNNYDKLDPGSKYIRPNVNVVTAVIATRDFEKQHQIWSTILSQKAPVRTVDPSLNELSLVNDGRGDTFYPSSFLLQDKAKISIYKALNDDGPINKVLTHRGANTTYHNMISMVTRDKLHEYWEQLEDAGFAMVDPKPLLLPSTGQHFFFVHPISTHNVVQEFVAASKLDKDKSEFIFDWSDVTTYIVPPDIK